MLSRFKKILLILVVSLALSFIVTSILQYLESTQIESITLTTTLTISNETIFSPSYEGFVKKGYFDSVAKVYVYLSSPYANYWETFNVWMSLDNSSWVTVPFLESITNNYTQMADLGLVSLNDPQLTIYQKQYIPPQTLNLPPNVTKQDATNLQANGVIKREATPSDTTQWIIVFFSVFGIIGFILNLILSGKDSESESRKIEKNKKKKSRKSNSKKRKKPSWDGVV